MTTPAQDAPLVLPSVVFRPVRLFVICIALTAVATFAAAWLGHAIFGVFFGLGLALGLVNALLIRRSVQSITAGAHPLKSKMVLNSATRLLVITVIGLVVAYLFQPQGLGVLAGLALFEMLLVATTALPVVNKLRSSAAEAGSGGEADPGTEGTAL